MGVFCLRKRENAKNRDCDAMGVLNGRGERRGCVGVWKERGSLLEVKLVGGSVSFLAFFISMIYLIYSVIINHYHNSCCCCQCYYLHYHH